MTQRALRSQLVSLVLVLLLHLSISEKTPECSKRFIDEAKKLDTENPESHRYIYGINSNGSTAASEVQTNPQSKAALEVLLEYAEYVRQTQQENEICSKKTPDVIQERARYFGFGEISDCGSAFTDESTSNASKLITAIKTLDKGVEEEFGMRVARDYQYNEVIGKFKNVYANNIFKFRNPEDSIRVCTAYSSIGYRVNGNWGIGMPFYRHDRYYKATATRQQFINEFVSIQDGETKSLPMSVPKCDFDLVADGFENVTAIFERWAGYVSWDHHASDKLEEHYALRNTLAESSVSKELLQDSRAPSNIAIIILPVLLTVFPIGLAQDVGGRTLAIYAIGTDIISVLPVLIKGFEMLIEGNKKYYSVVSRIYGSTNSSETGIVQIFPAECSVNSSIRIYGIVFICIGFLAMIIGIALEIITMKQVRKNQNEWREERENLLGKGKKYENSDPDAVFIGETLRGYM